MAILRHVQKKDLSVFKALMTCALLGLAFPATASPPSSFMIANDMVPLDGVLDNLVALTQAYEEPLEATVLAMDTQVNSFNMPEVKQSLSDLASARTKIKFFICEDDLALVKGGRGSLPAGTVVILKVNDPSKYGIRYWRQMVNACSQRMQ